MKKCVFIFLLKLLCLGQLINAQEVSIDSLLKVFRKEDLFSEKYATAERLHYQISHFHRNSGYLDTIGQVWSQVAEVAEVNKDTLALANIMIAHAEIISAGGMHDSSIVYLQKALNYFTLLNHQAGISKIYLDMCSAYQGLYQFHTAVKYAFKSIEISTQLSETWLINEGYWQLGRIYLDRKKEPQKAIEYFSKKYKLENKVTLSTCPFLAESYLLLHNMDSAKYYLDKVKPTIDKLFTFQRAYYYRATAKYYQYTGLTDSASFYFHLALNDLATVHQEHNSAQCYIHLGEIAFRNNNLSLAEKYYSLAESYAIKFKREFLLPEIYFGLCEVYWNNSMSGQAYSMFRKYKEIIEKLGKAESIDLLTSTDLQYQFTLKEQQLKEEKLKKEFEMQALVQQKERTRIYTISGLAAIFLFGAYGFYDFRKRKKLEKQQALANEWLRISRDLHDDLGASLSSISVFSSAVKQKLVSNEIQEAEKLLDRMSTDAQEMVSGMSELVWTINPHNDTLEILTDRLQAYGAAMLAAKNILFTLQCREELKDIKLSMVARKNIFLIFKEAINNTVKYSDATQAELTIYTKETLLFVKLSDNGKGFDLSHAGTNTVISGNGLKNMQKRAEETAFRIEIKSEINLGTSVSISCPLPKIREN